MELNLYLKIENKFENQNEVTINELNTLKKSLELFKNYSHISIFLEFNLRL